MLKALSMLAAASVAVTIGMNVVADEIQEKSDRCCGASGVQSQRAVGHSTQAAGLVNDNIENCICLQYVHTYWGDGTCSYYATDCSGSPFNWDDLCDLDVPQSCEVDSSGNPISCGTCIYYPQFPAPRMGAGNARLTQLPDHSFEVDPIEEAGARLFDEPFFVEVGLPGSSDPLRAKVFPILVERRVVGGKVLSAQVFYLGAQIRDFPEGAKVRRARGLPTGTYGCRAVDHERVLQIRTHANLDG